MSKFYIINLLDKIFITSSIFLIIFAWINFYLRDLKISFILSLIFTFAVLFVFFYYLCKKNEKKHLTKLKIENVEKSYFAFKILSKFHQVELLNSMLLNSLIS